jgi:GDPmannose 4,6-dehydratase
MRALIIGANGQDGRLIAEILKSQRFEVFGAIRGSAQKKAEGAPQSIFQIDMTDKSESQDFLSQINPDFIFHLAAVHAPSHSMKATELDFLEAMNLCHVGITENILKWQKANPASRSLIALSSQMFLNNPDSSRLITEATEPDSETPYGVSKRGAWQRLKASREEYGVHTSGAILFNHTSSLSKPGFLFPTLVVKIQKVLTGHSSEVQVLNESSYLDVTHSKEICDAMIRMVDQKIPGDFVLGSGKTLKIRDLLEGLSGAINLDFQITSSSSPKVVHCLKSSPINAKQVLNWEAKISAVEILATMILESQDNSE